MAGGLQTARGHRAPALVCAAVTLVCGALAGAGAASASPAPRGRAAASPVRAGPAVASPAPRGGTPGGPVSQGIRLHVAVTLRPRNAAALAEYARAVSTPGDPDFRRYLTPAQFAARFGAGPAQITGVRRALIAAGLAPGPVSAGGLSIPLTATAGRLERAFRVSLRRWALPGRRTAIAAGSRPVAPGGSGATIQAVLGLDTTAAPRPLLARAPAGAHAGEARAAGGEQAVKEPAVSEARTAQAVSEARTAQAVSGPRACATARAEAPLQTAYTADQIAAAYGFPGLYAAGDGGAGVTVAVYELESDDPSDVAAYQSCYGTHARISYIPIDGGAGGGAGSGEAALDIENLIGLVPDANVLVYQGPNSNSGAPGAGPYDTLSAIINQDRARVINVSWGQCEAIQGRSAASAESSLLAQAAVQGQSVVAAAGDSGAEDCDAGGSAPQLQAAVDDPASQPLVTGVGGTSLSTLGPPPSESVWNSGGSIALDQVQPGAGGGGVSTLWPMPAAQLDAAPGLGVLNPLATGPVCGRASGYCREVPDVAADADPATGYLIYFNGRGRVPDEPVGWQGIGGTSGAAPVWTALLTLADASAGCARSPIGYAGPALYRAASSAYAADFNDVTAGDNDFTGTNGGQFLAAPGYDLTTGLGSPDAAPLARALCADTVALAAPAPQSTTLHARASLRLRAGGVIAGGVTYLASGLPPGLRLNPATGLITGRVRRTGRFDVRVAARDGEGSTGAASFVWTVGAPPRLSDVALAQSAGDVVLSFTVSTSPGAPSLAALALTLPRTLALRSRRGVSVSTGGKHPRALRFTDRRAGAGGLVIDLRRAATRAHVRLTAPALAVRGGIAPLAAAGAGRRLALSLTATDARAGRVALTGRISVTP